MKENKYSEMSLEQLEKALKQNKFVIGLLGGALFFLIAINIVLAFKKGFSAMSAVPVALLPILIIGINTIKEIKQEISARKSF